MSAIAGIRERVDGGLGRSYWKLWLASAGSNLSDGIFWTAMPLLALSLTDSPALIAGVTVASRLPWLLFALVAGALADRLDRRRTMMLVDLGRAGLLGALAVMVGANFASIPLLYGLVFALGVAETLFDTSAQSIMPTLVDRERLSRANGRLYAAELTMNQFVGPPLGGLLAAFAISAAFGVGAAAYLIAAFLLFSIAGSFRPVREGPATRLHEEIGEGLRYLLGHPVLRVLAVMVGVMNFVSNATFAIFVVFAVAPGPLGLTEVGFGVLLTGYAIGSIVGSVFVERVERWLGRANLLAGTVAVTALATLLPAFTSEAWIVGATFVVGGAASIMWNVVTVSLRQRIVPDQLLGRLNASYRMLAWGTMPIGAAFGGVLAEFLGIRAVFVVGAGLIGFLLLARLIVTDEAIAAAELEAPAPPDGEAPPPPDVPPPPSPTESGAP